MEDDSFYYYSNLDTDLDLSFTSTTSDRTFGSSSARSSLARSSLTLSFNERLSLSSATPQHHYHHHTIHHHRRPHRRSDPHWSAIKAAINLSGDGRLHLRHLKLLRLLGSGNLGRVFLCRIRDYPNPNSQFALKVVDKDSLSPKKLAHVQTEAQILSLLDHPFLPTLYAHIEVSHYTCLLIDYCSGGDLHSLLRKQPGNRLPVQAVKFYAAEVLVALEYLHSLGIVYRDLKPENILIREDGHIMLSDFDLCFTSDVSATVEMFDDHQTVGMSRSEISCSNCFDGVERRTSSKSRSRSRDHKARMEFVAEPTSAFSKSCVGTHEYLAPELVSGSGHGNGVDWWAFGVLIYELLYGTTPFKGANKEATLRNIASRRDVGFCHVAAEERENEERLARDLIERLLVKDPLRRMGATRGAAEIKRHPFFAGIKWALIRSYRPPEVRGGVVRRSRSHVSGLQMRRKWWWRGLNCFLKKKVFSSSSGSSSKVLLHNSGFKSVVSVNNDVVSSRNLKKPTMPDSETKLRQNRIHLFDPVALISDGSGVYRASNNADQPRRVAQSCDGFPEGNANGRVRSYDSFTDAHSEGLRSYDGFSMDVKSGRITAYDHSEYNNDNSSNPRVDAVEVGFREIPMYTAITTANGTYDHSVKEPNGGVLMFGVDLKAEDEYDVTPRVWKPNSLTSPKARGSPVNPTHPRSVSSSPLHSSTPKAMGSPLNPSSPRSFPSSPLHPSSTRGSPLNSASPHPINSSPLNPTSHKFVNSSPLHPTSPKHPGSPLHPNRLHHRPMSPNSRVQAIARGRKELMEMVRDLPETFYELSLKDIVERKADMEDQKEIGPPEEKKPPKESSRQQEKKDNKTSSNKKGKKSAKKKMSRSRSPDNGKFLLKTSVFPILLGSKKSKKNLGASGSFKIAPLPKPQPTPTQSTKGPEKEWWRRRSCISSESDESNGLSSRSTSSGSSRSSSRSNSDSGNRRRSGGFLRACCFFNARNLRRIKDKK